MQEPEPKTTSVLPVVVADPHAFDLEHYQSRMERYLRGVKDNHIFFDALSFAHELHAGQRRKSGAPYISHPCAVAEILAWVYRQSSYRPGDRPPRWQGAEA